MDSVKSLILRFWAIPLFGVWAAALFFSGTISTAPYGIEEQAARGLLLNWSVSDNVINPIVTLGIPDFRALMFVPVGVYWTGNMLAAKIFTAALAFAAAFILFRWTSRHSSQEAGGIALVLFVISPILIHQADALGAGIFLLLCFAIGSWLDREYRSKPRMFGGWFFLHMLLITVAVTLQPIAIAYPLALALLWKRNPDPTKSSLHVYIGTLIAVVLAVALKGGWSELTWLRNPIDVLAISVQGHVPLIEGDVSKVLGAVFIGLLATVLFADREFLVKDQLGFSLALAALFGFLVASSSWALICAALVLFRGVPLLIAFNNSLGQSGFLGQRGIVTACAFMLMTVFLLEDKKQSIDHRLRVLSPLDSMISQLAVIASDLDQPFRAASQWPGQTMLATRRDVLGLPPELSDQASYTKAVKGLTHVIFDPSNPENKHLVDFFAANTALVETLVLEPAVGVILQVREHEVKVNDRRAKSAEQPPSEVQPINGESGGDSNSK